MDELSTEAVEAAEQPPIVPDIPGNDAIENVREAARALSNWRKQKQLASAPAESDEPAPQEELAQEADTAPDEQPSGETEAQEPSDETPIDAPMSWSAEEKERFKALPRETQEYLVKRETERDADFRRRQNELAELRKAIGPEQQAYAQARQQYEQALPQVLQMLYANSEFADIRSDADVQKLAKEDWPRYVQWDAHQKQIAKVQHELEQSQIRQSQEWQQTWDNYAQEQDKLFAEKVPEINDPKKGKEIQDLTVNTLQNDYGFTPQEMQTAWNGAFRDHRVQMLLLDAARYRQLKKNPPKPAPKQAPPVQKPGSSAAAVPAMSERMKSLQSKPALTLKEAAELSSLRRKAAQA